MNFFGRNVRAVVLGVAAVSVIPALYLAYEVILYKRNFDNAVQRLESVVGDGLPGFTLNELRDIYQRAGFGYMDVNATLETNGMHLPQLSVSDIERVIESYNPPLVSSGICR